MSIIINPGSGPVPDASAEEASKNIQAFAADLRERGHDVALGECGLEDEGRYSFVVTVDGITREIEMPGIPLDQVRWLNEPEQNIWDFPRLYVDGSSWVWKYALSACDVEDDS